MSEKVKVIKCDYFGVKVDSVRIVPNDMSVLILPYTGEGALFSLEEAVFPDRDWCTVLGCVYAPIFVIDKVSIPEIGQILRKCKYIKVCDKASGEEEIWEVPLTIEVSIEMRDAIINYLDKVPPIINIG